MEQAVKTRVDEALRYVVSKLDLISSAHVELGIPISDLICCAVRKRLSPDSEPMVRANELVEDE